MATTVVVASLVPTLALRVAGAPDPSSGMHVILAAAGVALAGATVVLLVTNLLLTRRVVGALVGIGSALAAAALIDGVHVAAIAGATGDQFAHSQATWTLTRLGRPLLLGVGMMLGCAYAHGRLPMRGLIIGAIALPVASIAASLALLLPSATPPWMLADSVQAGSVPFVLFALIGVTLGPRIRSNCPGPFIDALLLGLIAEMGAQLHLLFGTWTPHGPDVLAAHTLMIIAGAAPFVGLAIQVARAPAPDVPAQDDLEREIETLFDVSLDMLCIADFDSRFLRVSPSFTRVLGWTESELLSRSFLELIHPDDVQRTLNEVEVLALGAQTTNFRNRYKSRDGTWRWFTWCATVDREAGKIYAVARDDTERVRYEQNLQHARDVAETISRTAGEALLTPVDAIATLSRQLESEYPTEHMHLAKLSNHADELKRLVTELLAASRN